VKLWLKDRDYVADNTTGPTKLPTLKDLYFEYKDYCEEIGVTGILGRTTFIRRLSRFGIGTVKAGKGSDSVMRVKLKKA
jgi:hypothetical protein